MNEMIEKYLKVIGGDIKDHVQFMEYLGVWALGWNNCEKTQTDETANWKKQLEDLVRRMTDDTETERQKLLSVYKRITSTPCGNNATGGEYIRCRFCGNEIETDSTNHAFDCLYMEAYFALMRQEKKP